MNDQRPPDSDGPSWITTATLVMQAATLVVILVQLVLWSFR